MATIAQYSGRLDEIFANLASVDQHSREYANYLMRVLRKIGNSLHPSEFDAFNADLKRRMAEVDHIRANRSVIAEQKAQADKERYARECAAEEERKAAAAAGQLVDPLRADVIAELMHEGHTQEIAQNMTNTPQKLVALAQKYDFV